MRDFLIEVDGRYTHVQASSLGDADYQALQKARAILEARLTWRDGPVKPVHCCSFHPDGTKRLARRVEYVQSLPGQPGRIAVMEE